MKANSQRSAMWVWVVITLAFIFGIFAPSILGVEGMHGGYAISSLCIFLAIIGIVVVFIYRSRASTLDAMLKHKNLLAHWTYTPQQWQDYTAKNSREEKSNSWGLYGLVMIIVIIVCFGFWLINRNSGILMIIMALGLAAILAMTILISTNYDHWQNKKYHGEVYITKNGALINRTLHIWHGWGARLEGVEYQEKGRMMEITYSVPNRNMRSTHTVHIPVPSGLEEKAKRVMALLLQDAGLISEDI
jgi:hypothetical protein